LEDFTNIVFNYSNRHEELMNIGGLYAGMWNEQLKSSNKSQGVSDSSVETSGHGDENTSGEAIESSNGNVSVPC
jgi:hypothetical protein